MKSFHILILIFLSACSVLADSPTIVLTPSIPSSVPTFAPTLTPFPTKIPTPTPTPIVPACQTAICNMPYSILVHSAQKDWLADLLPIISENYIDLTYDVLLTRAYYGHPPTNDLIIITIDDLSTYYLPPRFYEMIEGMRAYGIVGTLAVVTEYPSASAPDPEIWAYYRELERYGWRIAIHTEHHYNFEWISDEQIELEIKTSYEKICENTLNCPSVLILPFGKGGDLPIVWKIARELGIIWIVGMDIEPHGNSFSGEPPYYVSRASIVEDIDEMFEILADMFPFEYAYDNE